MGVIFETILCLAAEKTQEKKGKKIGFQISETFFYF